jgi:hypothetical protein
MADVNVEELDPEIIERLMKTDPAFMAKISDVKTRIYDGLSVYADSLKESENGMFTSEEVSEITSAKDTVMKSWDALQKRLNVDLSETFKPSSDEASGNEGVFEQETPSFILERIGDDAITQIKQLIKGGDVEDSKKVDTAKIPGGGGLKGVMGNLLGSASGALMAGLGLKAPTWLLSLAKGAGAAAPIVMLAGGIIWAAIDGIRGFLNADKWGVSKVSGALGGLLGGMDRGIRGALKNMGKWALIGAGLGSIFPVVGTILGGIIGGVVGAILGWVGGERMAKAFDAVGRWFYEQWEIITDYWGDAMLVAWEWLQTVGTSIKDWFNMVTDYWGDAIFKAGEWLQGAWQSVKDWFNMVTDYWGGVILKAGEWLQGAWQSIKDWFNMITDFWAGVITNVTTWFDNLTTGIAEVFGEIGDWFGGIKDSVMGNFTKIKGWFADKLKLLDPRNWGKSEAEGGPDADMSRLMQDNQEEVVKRRTNDPPKMVSSEVLAADKKAQEALDANNLFAEQMVEALKEMNQNHLDGVDVQAKLLQDIAEKPVASGGGEVSLDFGEIRESTLDASFNFRSKYHSSRGI